LSLVLRHNPAAAGITLDASGWCDINSLIAGATAKGKAFTRDELLAVVASNDKQRFAISDDGLRIRANQGHSVEVDLELPSALPPEILYHGTVERFLDSIRREGLRKKKRHHVHLSADVETASRVGDRRGEAIILSVAAGAMSRAGHEFFLSANGVWLVDAVPPAFLTFPD
ncbi:MAG: RNA 2'-phosphotransferase, partial [Phycisphaerales bacterium]